MAELISPVSNYKIAFYGFGSYPAILRHLIALTEQKGCPIRWCAILPTPYYRSVIGDVLPQSEILDVFRSLPQTPVGGDLHDLVEYRGSLIEDLAAQKRRRRRRSGDWLFKRGFDYFKLFRQFLAARGVTHLFSPMAETPEAKIAVAAAHSLGLGVVAPTDLRSITGTYFAGDCYATPPGYATADAASRAKAIEFIDKFRRKPTSARSVPAEVFAREDSSALPDFIPALLPRFRQFIRDVTERPDIFDHDEVRRVVMANVGFLRSGIRGRRARVNARVYDYAGVEELPERFIFYPLQYTPESSINAVAPFFIDQTRVLDAIRFAMSGNYTLVVKEHPACLPMRPISFLRGLRAVPGVKIIKATTLSTDVMRHAALTMTVTGTAALEAFLLARPVLPLGPGISSWVTGRQANLANLRAEIQSAIAQPPSDDFVIAQIAKLMSVRFPFVFDTPHLPGEPVLRMNNLEALLVGLLDHLGREHVSQAQNRAAIG